MIGNNNNKALVPNFEVSYGSSFPLKTFSTFAIWQKTYYFTHLFTFLFLELWTDRLSLMKAMAWCYYSKYSLLLWIASFHLWINFLRLLSIQWSYIRDMTPVKYHMNLAPLWNFLFRALSDRFLLVYLYCSCKVSFFCCPELQLSQCCLLVQTCCCICASGFQLGFNEISARVSKNKINKIQLLLFSRTGIPNLSNGF